MNRPKLLCSDFFLDILYPNKCPACHRVIAWNETFCKECESHLEYIEELPWQSIFPAQISGEDVCFDYANALFRYEGTARQAVLSFKNRGAFKFAEYVAQRLQLKFESDGIEDIDIVTAVPMHKIKQLNRGYNQADIFAKKMAKQLNIRCDLALLGHRKAKREQHSLGRKERAEMAERMYYIKDKKRSLDGKNILICDDIFTTGSTINSCALLLKAMGAGKIYAATVCRTLPKEEHLQKE